MKFPYKRFARGTFPPDIRPIIPSSMAENLKRIKQEKLEQELLKGLRSRLHIMTPTEWKKLKREILSSIKQ